jgi:hypothetical protein
LLSKFGQEFPKTLPGGQTIPGAPSNAALSEGINALEAVACAGPQRRTFIRVGEHNGNLYLDLGRADWSAVEITPTGWRVIPVPPVPFLRPNGLRPLPVPVAGGSIAELRPFVNARNDRDFLLMTAFLVAALRPNGPYPVMIINGEQGSAKSTTCRVIRRLIDPNAAELRTVSRDERDWILSARNSHMLSLDNQSSVDADLSDSICRIATGNGSATRSLYSDTEETIINICRPVVLNGIPILANRPDLAERAVQIVLPPLPDTRRRTEAKFWHDFEAASPRLLGALLDGVVMALHQLPTITLPYLPRMADFALWAEAAGPAFGWSPGAFLAAYEQARSERCPVRCPEPNDGTVERSTRRLIGYRD